MKNMLFSLALVLILVVSVSADQFRTVRTNGKLVLSKSPAFAVQTISAGATSVNLSSGTVVVTGINTGSTAITAFSNAVAGQIIYIVGNASTTSNATTIADSGAFKLSASFTASADDSLTLFVRGSGDYVELSRSNN
jgi:hypothetical protein